MLNRYDAFDVTSKSIRSDSSQVVSICCSQSGWHGQVWGCKSWFTLKPIRPKAIRPNWDQFDHGQFVYVYSLDTIFYPKPLKV